MIVYRRLVIADGGARFGIGIRPSGTTAADIHRLVGVVSTNGDIMI